MDISKIGIGKNPPETVNVLIEIPMHSDPIKYEFDKTSGFMLVDRIMQAPMHYPCNYGFIPHTLSEDGDPTDVLVITDYKIYPGAIISVRPVAVLMMEDESGFDEKIIAVPDAKTDISYSHIQSLNDLSQFMKDKIYHFFENYKKLEKGKWVKILGFEDRDKAFHLINEATKRAGGLN